MTRKRYAPPVSLTSLPDEILLQSQTQRRAKASMDAMDQLPAEVRAAIAEAKTPISSIIVLRVLDEGAAIGEVIDAIKLVDSRQAAKRRG